MLEAEAQAQLQSQAVRLQPMYVIVGDGHIFGFGLTPKKAMEHFSGMTGLPPTRALVRRPSTDGFRL